MKEPTESNRIETFILRFRDMVVGDGDTIKLHRTICDEKGYVWWAQWAKEHESVPVASFENLRNRAVSKTGLNIFLFDSGTEAFYPAVCNEVFFDEDQPKHVSPEASHTPEYYNQQLFPVWFKLTEISEQPINSSEIVGTFEYRYVREAFKREDSSFAFFDHQIISSTQELSRQNRTIWFVVRPEERDETSPVGEQANDAQTTLVETLKDLAESLRPLEEQSYIPSSLARILEEKTLQAEALTAKVILPSSELMAVHLTPLHVLEKYKQDSSDLTYIHIGLGATIGAGSGFLTGIFLSKDFEWTRSTTAILVLLILMVAIFTAACIVFEMRRASVWAKLHKGDAPQA
jgi:hypothetical protein